MDVCGAHLLRAHAKSMWQLLLLPTSAELPRNLRKGRLSMKRYDYPINSLCVVDHRIDVDPLVSRRQCALFPRVNSKPGVGSELHTAATVNSKVYMPQIDSYYFLSFYFHLTRGSVNLNQRCIFFHIRAQELCESWGGHPGLPSLINPPSNGLPCTEDMWINVTKILVTKTEKQNLPLPPQPPPPPHL